MWKASLKFLFTDGDDNNDADTKAMTICNVNVN